MVSAALSLLLTLIILFGVAWAICWVLDKYAPQVPKQVQGFIYLVAAIIAIMKLVAFAGVF